VERIEAEGDTVDHVLSFLEYAGCFLLWATYLVVLRAVAHAKRPDADASSRDPALLKRRDEGAGLTAKSVA
jgi:hypothetical protein